MWRPFPIQLLLVLVKIQFKTSLLTKKIYLLQVFLNVESEDEMDAGFEEAEEEEEENQSVLSLAMMMMQTLLKASGGGK